MKESNSRKIDHAKKLHFERERLLNLIDSRIRRRDIETARKFAEELFNTEFKFAILSKMRELKKHNALLLKIILFMVSVLLVAVTFMILNINPSFSLIVQTFTVLAIISFVVLDTMIVTRFEDALARMMDTYETRKQSFIEYVLDNIKNQRAPDFGRELSNLIF